MELTQQEVRELLNYNFITGVFTWKVSIKGTKGKGRKAGTITNKGYDDVCIRGKKYGLHRLAFLYMEGHIPENVDHENGMKGCNAWHNLRAATISQNGFNLKGRSKTGYKNVYWDPRGIKKFMVIIRENGKQHSCGYYYTAEEANVAATAARNKLHGEFAKHVQDNPL
jgi:hypothetical protein